MAPMSTAVEGVAPAGLAASPASRPEGGALRGSRGHLVPTLAVAAAVAGALEVVVARITAPLVGFLAPAGHPVGSILEAVGGGVTAAGALLVVVAAAGCLARRRPREVVASALLLAAVVSTVAAAVSPSPALLTSCHLIIAAAAIAITRGEWGRHPAGRAAVTLAALGVTCGQLALLVVGDAGIGLHRLAQLAIVAVPVAAAWRFRGQVRSGGWATAVVAATVVWVALAMRGGEVAMLSTWALGATLTIPPLVVVAAAAGWAVLAVGAVRRPGMRLVVAGVTLLWVAGIQPTAVHHNLTGLLGVMLLAGLVRSVRGSDAEVGS